MNRSIITSAGKSSVTARLQARVTRMSLQELKEDFRVNKECAAVFPGDSVYKANAEVLRAELSRRTGCLDV